MISNVPMFFIIFGMEIAIIMVILPEFIYVQIQGLSVLRDSIVVIALAAWLLKLSYLLACHFLLKVVALLAHLFGGFYVLSK